MKRGKITVVGLGSVGSAVAFSLVQQNVGRELVLVDVDENRAIGETLDLQDATNFSSVKTVNKGTGADARDSQIIVITAGAAQRPGESRLELMQRNINIVAAVLKDLHPIHPESTIIVVANPVDILTRYVQEHSGLPRNQVFGSGTLLDTLRLRGAIAEKIKVNTVSVHAHVFGEHGDSQFAAFSCAHVSGLPLSQFPELTPEVLEDIAVSTRKRALTIIDKKRFTCWGIGGCTAVLCRAVLNDQHAVYPVSWFVEELGVCLSVPTVIGLQGVVRQLPLHISDAEKEKLAHSASVLKKYYEDIQH